jgi:hypothetical protein
MRIKKRSFWIWVVVFLLTIASTYFLFSTTKGSTFITKLALSKYVKSDDISIKEIKGNLLQALFYEDIVIENLKFLPQGSILKIKKLDFSFTSFGISGLHIKIHNGTLKIPGSDKLFFYGKFQGGELDINVYSKYVSVRDTLDLFVKSSALKKISGVIDNLDIYIKGVFLEPTLEGEIHIKNLSHDGFSMTGCPILLNVQLKDIFEGVKLYGKLSLDKGVLTGPKTAVVTLFPSDILFNGDPTKPSFDLKGTSTVEGTKIDISLKGTIEVPNLKLTSSPSLPQDKLLVMLATNKSWKSFEAASTNGQISADVAKDFIDYFAFSGTGSKIAQQFGISDISFTFEKEKKGVGVKKSITEKIDASYAVEQSQGEEGEVIATHTIGGEYKITENISVGAETELQQESETESTGDSQESEKKAILKFQKEF